jgi:hypothetical protein
MKNKNQYLNADGEYFEVEGSEAYYMTEDELCDASDLFQNELQDIKMDLQDLVHRWMGHANFVWATLTPDHLTELNARCGYIKKNIGLFLEDVYRVLGTRGSDSYYQTAADYEDEIYCNHEFELNLMQVIQKSFEFSSGQSQGMDGIIDLEWFEQKYAGTWMRRLLNPVAVKPWNMPAAPAFIVPERPRVILKVLSIADCAPRISVGLDDIFCDKPIGTGILVDDDVRVGDRVIIKTSGWKGLGHEMEKPEYDGLAERDCPCSDMVEVMEAKYNFDLEFELERHEAQWRKSFLEKHFTLRTEGEIKESGKRTCNMIGEREVRHPVELFGKNYEPEYYNHEPEYYNYEDK